MPRQLWRQQFGVATDYLREPYLIYSMYRAATRNERFPEIYFSRNIFGNNFKNNFGIISEKREYHWEYSHGTFLAATFPAFAYFYKLRILSPPSSCFRAVFKYIDTTITLSAKGTDFPEFKAQFDDSERCYGYIRLQVRKQHHILFNYQRKSQLKIEKNHFNYTKRTFAVLSHFLFVPKINEHRATSRVETSLIRRPIDISPI